MSNEQATGSVLAAIATQHTLAMSGRVSVAGVQQRPPEDPLSLNSVFLTALDTIDDTPQLRAVAESFTSFRYQRKLNVNVPPRALMAAYMALGITDQRITVSAAHRLLTVTPGVPGPLTADTREHAGLPDGPVSRAMVQYTADLIRRDTSHLPDDVRLWPTGNG